MKTGVSIRIITSELLSRKKITKSLNQLKQWNEKHVNRTVKHNR